MNTLKKTIALLLVVSLAALAGCSDDNKANNNKNNADNDTNILTDTGTNNDKKDVEENDQKDVEDTDKDVEDTDKDVEDTDKDVEDTDKDVEDTEVIEVDGTLALKDLTAEQVNVICNYRFDQFEPNYDPSTDSGKGNCFDEGINEAYAVPSNAQKPAKCQSVMDACMAKEYKREDINIDNCLDPEIRKTCEVTVEEYKTCARDLAAASIANLTGLLAKTCQDLATGNGQSAVEDLSADFDYPTSCDKIDNDCTYMQLHQN